MALASSGVPYWAACVDAAFRNMAILHRARLRSAM
jgi:hypothetical protein